MSFVGLKVCRAWLVVFVPAIPHGWIILKSSRRISFPILTDNKRSRGRKWNAKVRNAVLSRTTTGQVDLSCRVSQ